MKNFTKRYIVSFSFPNNIIQNMFLNSTVCKITIMKHKTVAFWIGLDPSQASVYKRSKLFYSPVRWFFPIHLLIRPFFFLILDH